MSGYSAVNRGPNHVERGAYLSGTCSSGEWVVWCPGNSKSDPANWVVQRAPISPTDWAAGAYMPAGICYNHGYEPKHTGDIVSIIACGFSPKGYVVDPGGAILNDGYPLVFGGGVGAAAPFVDGDTYDIVGCALEIPGVTTRKSVKCIVRNIQ